MSSYVLDKAQRVTDRIGVVRTGPLIAVERMADLRQTSLNHIGAWFSDMVSDAALANVPGVRALAVTGGR